MIKKLHKILSSLPAIIIAGLALLVSIILHLAHRQFFFDPAYLVLLICLPPILYWAIYYVLQAKLTASLLISLAVISATAIGEVLAAAEVVFIIAVGEILEEIMVERFKKHLLGLHHLYPKTAHLLKNTNTKQYYCDCAVSKLKLNDVVRIFPGEMIATDGVIVAGNTSINQAILTGESLPVDKQVGQQVFAGTQNQFGTIDVRVNKVGQQVFIKQLIALVKTAKKSSIPLQQTIDGLATILIPLALLSAVLTWLISSWLGLQPLLALRRGITVLVVFCPCALALATPVTMIAAIAAAIKRGILIKSPLALEYLARLHTLAFDKTGTLTTAVLKPVYWQSFSSRLSKSQLLALAASVQARSEHPLAKAIVKQAVAAKLPLQTVVYFQVLLGQGVKGKLANRQIILCGSESLFKKQHIKLPLSAQELLSECYRRGQSVVLVAIDNHLVGLIACADTCRRETPVVLAKLRQCGVQLLLFSGDNQGAVASLAKKLGIDNFHSQLLPVHKADLVRSLQKQGKYVGMVGDGINDALALQEATVGIAMLQVGNDLALDAAKVVILNGNLFNLIYLRHLAQATLLLIKWDIGLSLVVNLGAILFSAWGFLLPVYGALLHNVGSVIVVGNAFLFYWVARRGFGAGKLLGLLYNRHSRNHKE